MGADDLGGDDSFGRMTGDLLPFQVGGAVLPGISPGLAFVLATLAYETTGSRMRGRLA